MVRSIISTSYATEKNDDGKLFRILGTPGF